MNTDVINDENLVSVLEDMESKNANLMQYEQQQVTSKTINVSNVSNVRHPILPGMYFPRSTVTIN